MVAVGSLDVVELVDRSRLGRFRLGMRVPCGVCLVVDGFDVGATGFVASAPHWRNA